MRSEPSRQRLLALSVLLLCAGCYIRTQRVPGPIPPLQELPDQIPPAALEALVQRHSDPVYIRRPSAIDDYPLPFFRKRERVAAGTVVRAGYGGRAELIWPGDASSVLLFDEGAVRIGNPELDEPLIEFLSVSRSLLLLTPEDRIVLPGGSVLRGDTVAPSGPFLLDRFAADFLRLTNQSKRPALLGYRDLEVEIAPGESIDLPLLEDTSPQPPNPAAERLEVGDRRLEILGRVQPVPNGNAVLLRAERPSVVNSRGTQVRLAPGEEAVFMGLRPVNDFPREEPEEDAP